VLYYGKILATGTAEEIKKIRKSRKPISGARNDIRA